MQRQELEELSREQLIAQAQRVGIARPRVLTRPDLIDEIIRRTATDEHEKAKARGWLGRARDLLSRVVERGLHLPEAARALRGAPEPEQGHVWPAPPPPMPTVTLAEIYAAQGHLDRARAVVDDVLARHPDHAEARALRARLDGNEQRAPAEGPKGRAPAAGHEAARKSADEAQGRSTPAPSEPAGEAPREERGASEVTSAGEALPASKPRDASAEETPPAEGAALPDRYDVDEIVAIAVDPRTLYLYWEVRPTTLARARARRSEGFLSVRVVGVTASWSGPQVRIRDLRVDALFGDRFVREIDPGANVRVSVGWKAGGDFEPFAVGVEVTVPHLAPMAAVAQDVAVWAPEAPNGAPGGGATPWEPAAPSAPDVGGGGRVDDGGGAVRLRASRGFSPPPSAGRPPSQAPVDSGVVMWTSAEHPIYEPVPGGDVIELRPLGEMVEVRHLGETVALRSIGDAVELRHLGEAVELRHLGDVVEVRRHGETIEIRQLGELVRLGEHEWVEHGPRYEWIDLGETREWVALSAVNEWSSFEETLVSYVDRWLGAESFIGASALGRGASALARRGSSALLRRGSSALLRRGSSALLRRGSSALLRRGGGEAVRRTMLERVRGPEIVILRRGSSELVRRSAFDLLRRGGSELLRRGASNLTRVGAGDRSDGDT
jgi:hypothetical protein